MFYTDTSCDNPLTNTPTPLVYGDCINVPIGGVKALSIQSLPACSDYGTPILLVSDQDACKNSTQGTGADAGVIGNCQAYSTGVDLKSAQFACFGRGISDAASSTAAESSSAAEPTMGSAGTTTGTDDEDEDHDDGGGSGSSCECCCCCIVM
jgi:hypothetical protein